MCDFTLHHNLVEASGAVQHLRRDLMNAKADQISSKCACTLWQSGNVKCWACSGQNYRYSLFFEACVMNLLDLCATAPSLQQVSRGSFAICITFVLNSVRDSGISRTYGYVAISRSIHVWFECPVLLCHFHVQNIPHLWTETLVANVTLNYQHSYMYIQFNPVKTADKLN